MEEKIIPSGVCCKEIILKYENNIVEDINFKGGCPGNLEAVRRLCKGKSLREVKGLLEGITCGNKLTSCCDQLAKGINNLL